MPRIAFIGEPNVGKSSIINAILGEERFITSPLPTPRASPTIPCWKRTDTATLLWTRPAFAANPVERGVERSGVLQTLNCSKHVDIAVLVLDAGKELDHQEKSSRG